MDKLLVVIDAQNYFVNQHCDHVRKPLAEFIENWCSTSRPVMYTRFINYDNSPYESLIGWDGMKSGYDTELIDELKPPLGPVFNKSTYSCFTNEVSKYAAQCFEDEAELPTLVICGFATDFCVLKTAVDAFERGYRPVVLRDRCASHRGLKAHEDGLEFIGNYVGVNQIVNSEDALSLS